MRVACISICAMGHFIPMTKCAEALAAAGHEVWFVTNDNELIKQRAEQMLLPYGIKMHYTADKLTMDDFLREKKEGEKHHVNDINMTLWQPFVNDACRSINPDIILSDYFSIVGVHAADHLKIPLVINVPGPVEFVEDYGLIQLPNMREAKSCCGMVCVSRGMKHCLIGLMAAKYAPKTISFYKSMTGRVCCFNSFWGIEKATCLPPNFRLVGSLNKPQNALLDRLMEKDKVLYDWLEEAQTLKMDVVLVSIGTICRF